MANSASGLAERFVNLFVQVWLYQYLIKRISPARYSVEAHTRDDDRRVTEITSTMFPVLLGTAMALALLGLVVTRYLGSILKIAPQYLSEGRLMVLLLFGSLTLRVALAPFCVGLFVRQKFVASNTLIMLQAIIRVVLLFVFLLGAGARVIWVVVAEVGAD